MEQAANYAIRQVDPHKDPRWNEFVDKHPRGLVYHHSAWADVLEATYGHSPFYLALEDPWTAEIEGIAPFFIVESLFTGKRVVSLPLTSYCELLIPKSEMSNILSFITNNVQGLDSVKMKLLSSITSDISSDEHAQYITHFVDLSCSLDELFKSFHPTSVRQRIRRAERNNLTFRLGDSEKDLKAFYELLTGVRRKHGLPPQPYSFYRNMWKFLWSNDLMFLAMVEHNGQVIAGSIVLKSKNAHHYEYTGVDHKSIKMCPNQMLLWEIIKIAHSEGAGYLDLGRSQIEHTSLIDYKERWNAQPKGLNYCSFPPSASSSAPPSLSRQGLEAVNRHLPQRLLQLEGRLLYSHMD